MSTPSVTSLGAPTGKDAAAAHLVQGPAGPPRELDQQPGGRRRQRPIGDEERRPGRPQGVHDGAHHGWVGRQPARLRRRCRQAVGEGRVLDGHLLEVDIEADQARPDRRPMGDRPAPVQAGQQRLGARRLIIPHGEVADQRALVVDGVDPVDPRPSSRGIERTGPHDQDHRRAVRPRVEDRHARVEESDRVVDADRHGPAAGLGEAMGHGDGDLLVEREQQLGAAAGGIDQRIVQTADGRAGIEGEVADPESREAIDQQIGPEPAVHADLVTRWRREDRPRRRLRSGPPIGPRADLDCPHCCTSRVQSGGSGRDRSVRDPRSGDRCRWRRKSLQVGSRTSRTASGSWSAVGGARRLRLRARAGVSTPSRTSAATWADPSGEGMLIGKVEAVLDDETSASARSVLDERDPLVCPWHGWEYDIETGECAANRRIRLAPLRGRQREERGLCHRLRRPVRRWPRNPVPVTWRWPQMPQRLPGGRRDPP